MKELHHISLIISSNYLSIPNLNNHLDAIKYTYHNYFKNKIFLNIYNTIKELHHISLIRLSNHLSITNPNNHLKDAIKSSYHNYKKNKIFLNI